MARTVAALFDNSSDAREAVQDLVNQGVSRNDISLVATDPRGEYQTYTTTGETKAAEGAGTGAVSGGVLGGVLGLLVGIGALAIPGIGPIVAAGPLAAALGSGGAGALVGAGVGAATGGVVGALVGLGIPEEEAGYYAEGVRRGGTLVTVSTDDATTAQVTAALQRHHPVDLDTRAAEWRRTGWNRFDPGADPYVR